ncbi:hypothetical protein JCGZ_06239 [Jatropha curcas]|uniref:Uncharacterized protein n=1 Tax=Jatropha curcas TaxID=180498 RepID=A0A067KQC8_JATCU|nr:uncharacterized protein LOC105634947 [Jatropha curcas]KDP37183.1 hypothetical protein JCGZ_06239 [Jatropha curcas]
MDRGFKEVVVLMILIAASLMVMVAESNEASPPPDSDYDDPPAPSHDWKHSLCSCSVECAEDCHPTAHHFPVLCMSKCALKCLKKSLPPYYFVSNCANSTTSNDKKQLESYRALEQVGRFVDSCYKNCKELIN